MSPQLVGECGMIRYLLNSAVITAPGLYSYRLLNEQEARNWWRWGLAKEWPGVVEAAIPPISAIGYAETASALSLLIGVDGEIPVNRISVTMQPGDEALIFRLVFPPGTQRIDPKDKGALGRAIIAGHYELGLLVRTA